MVLKKVLIYLMPTIDLTISAKVYIVTNTTTICPLRAELKKYVNEITSI